MRRRFGGAAFGAVVLLAVGPRSAWAQSDFRREVFGAAGIGAVYDDEGSIGSGINGGGGVGYRLSRRFGLEAEVNAFRTRREFASSFPPFRGHGIYLLGDGLLYLSRGRGQAYLIGGAGLLHFTTDVNFGGIAVNASDTAFALSCGFGVKIFATPHVSIRPEIRIYGGGAGSEPPTSIVRLSLGAGYHW